MPVMSTPSSRICPDVGASRPASKPSSVLFPLPDAPMIATNWPRSTSKSMPFRISTVWVAVSMRFETCRATMAAWFEPEWFDWFDIVPLYLLFWHRVARFSLFLGLLALMSCGQPKPAEEPIANPAAPAIPTPPSQSDARPVIAAFGDSLTAGFGLEAGLSYPDFLQKEIPDWHVVN